MESGPRARVTLLDTFAVDLCAARPDTSAGTLPPTVQRLVAHICLAGRPSRAAVAARLWPDAPEHQAHGSLRSALWRLHRAAPGVVDASGGALELTPGVQVDVRELITWARRVSAHPLGVDDVVMPDAAVHGELLPGWHDEWVLVERERVRQLRLHALETLAVRLAGAGRYGPALEVAYTVAGEEPFRESAHRVIVGVHIAEGNVAEARRVYERFRVLLLGELGVAPTEQMTRLVYGGRPRPDGLPTTVAEQAGGGAPASPSSTRTRISGPVTTTHP